MLKTIHKFALNTEPTQVVMMPEGAKVLSAQVQFNCPYIWAECDPLTKYVERTFNTYRTGSTAIDNDIKENYIGTYQLDGGNYILHLYELLK